MTPQEARRQAVIAFGGVERTKEESHQQRPSFYIETVLQDIRYALRGFARNPVFTLTILVTLMLGIGATTAVFSIVDRILFRSLPYAHADRLVSVGMVHSLATEFMLGYFYYDWQRAQKPFEALTSERADDRRVRSDGEKPGATELYVGRRKFSAHAWGLAGPRAKLPAARRSPQRAKGGAHLLRPLALPLQPGSRHSEQAD